MDDYKFQSDITKKCLPYGVSHLSELQRAEISGLLKTMEDSAKNKCADWIRMFFLMRLANNDSWDEEFILFYLKNLRSDIYALKGKLKE